MGFTGPKALEWKIRYINAFNEMEKELKRLYDERKRWEIEREKCVLVRHILTDTIKTKVKESPNKKFTILEIGRRQVKAFLDSKQELINKQKEALKQTMGIELYNKDVDVVKNAVKTVEQLGKEFNWEGAIKHSKVLELIEGKTALGFIFFVKIYIF
ncbi:hypothetical protein F502_10278 [Clostridium pasteurianum DSM 525 = ATCC 6013]|nr:Rha family transcriptional regulator [Clostridium pasteurianum]ELP59258.1 hypothetical protein F502_10278 [Clostridium pasteurianum DSM 525 = ATCC 6013]